MKTSTIKSFFVDAFKSIKRNKTISFASIITVSATLFIFGIFIMLALNINRFVGEVESKVEIKVFLKEDVTISDQKAIEDKLRKTEGVKEVAYESKSEALQKFKEQLKENASLLSGYDSSKNPMPSSFVVKLTTPEAAESVGQEVTNMSGVDEIGNDEDLVKSIITISKSVKWAGIILFIILVGVSLFLIGNTIKLTVFSRRREIGIMKFVGATDWFIRWPFIIEGMTMGVFGALIADVLLYYIYRLGFIKITESLMTAQMVSPNYIINPMLWAFILSGIIIGALGSIISLRKFLDV
ncbi:permease-like cell division protein FtsX [Clostridium sp. MSJ-4]|uniref:Cell division protein FtsX n=1 Tax=Clostridium simiarum TaxID=2841506 RepID=A0ABS6F249_9CLOT|nr:MULTISPECIES: permease-like cell division protein FtsX [Clostridium]MBU5592581.1 permease-like cell division protein FtsX [Clostridium simiarum]